jgi:hypothetical protein
VLDVTEDSARYGRLITTVPVPGLGNVPDHSEHAIPVIAGHYYLVTVPAWNAVVSADISDPTAPREVGRVTLGTEDVPHWIAISPDHRRVVVTGYGAMEHRVLILTFDATSGQLAIDRRFREEGDTTKGFRMDNKAWPHGGNAVGSPHGAVFGRKDGQTD